MPRPAAAFPRMALAALGLATACAGAPARPGSLPAVPPVPVPRLGNFSVSLVVKDLAASRAFYERLGFRPLGGDPRRGWLILQNDGATVGLFEEAIQRNTLTFNPGWSREAAPLADFDDVREIQRLLKERGVPLAVEADPASTGPAFLVLHDPDGNPVLIDQHVPRPAAGK